MFSSRTRQKERQGKHGTSRVEYLKQLVTEFQHTQSIDAKREIAANLANFGYDPLNFDDLLSLNICDLYVDCLDESDAELKQFGLAGLTNVCTDGRFCKAALEAECIPKVIKFLSSTNVENVLNAMVVLIWLAEQDASARAQITSRAIIDAMKRYSSASNPRLKNMASIFLVDIAEEKSVSLAPAAPATQSSTGGVASQQPLLRMSDLAAMNDKPLY